MPKPSRNPAKLLLVEGPNDKHVISHLCAQSGYERDFCIREKGDINQLLDSIGAEILAPGRRRLAIVADADCLLSGRWDSIVYRFKSEGITFPEQIDPGGTVIEGNPRLGVWIMPDNINTGELEHFVSAMIPDDDVVWPRSVEYINGISPDDRPFKPKKEMRAKVLSWLATREEPGFVGQGIHRDDLKIDGELCIKFVRWLRQVFD